MQVFFTASLNSDLKNYYSWHDTAFPHSLWSSPHARPCPVLVQDGECWREKHVVHQWKDRSYRIFAGADGVRTRVAPNWNFGVEVCGSLSESVRGRAESLWGVWWVCEKFGQLFKVFIRKGYLCQVVWVLTKFESRVSTPNVDHFFYPIFVNYEPTQKFKIPS